MSAKSLLQRREHGLDFAGQLTHPGKVGCCLGMRRMRRVIDEKYDPAFGSRGQEGSAHDLNILAVRGNKDSQRRWSSGIIEGLDLFERCRTMRCRALREAQAAKEIDQLPKKKKNIEGMRRATSTACST